MEYRGQEALDVFAGAIASLFRESEQEYKPQGKMTFQGLPIIVENKKGSVRSGTGPNGKKWKTKMKFPYGRIKETGGTDGDSLDCYVGPDEDAEFAYIIHTRKPPKFEKYDEDKAMLGFGSADDSKKAFLDHYDDEGFFGSMTTMSMEDFKKLLKKDEADGEKLTADLIESRRHREMGVKGMKWGEKKGKTEREEKILREVRKAVKLTQKQYLKKQYGTEYHDFLGRRVRWSGAEHEIRNAKHWHEAAVKWALERGIPVGQTVFKEYPGLLEEPRRFSWQKSKESQEVGVKGMKWGVSGGEKEPESPGAKKAKELGLNRPVPKNEQEQKMADIIEKSGALWGGIGEGLVYFHDPENSSTLAINLNKREVTSEAVRSELSKNRKAYGIEEPEEKKADVLDIVSGHAEKAGRPTSRSFMKDVSKKWGKAAGRTGESKKRRFALSKESVPFEDRLTFFVRRLQEAKSKRVYFARSLKRYGTNREAADFDRLEEMFPDDDIVAIRCKLGKTGKKGKMPYYHAKVEEADVVVIQPLRGRRISSGVWSEARHAMKKRIPVKMIMPDGSLRRVKKFRFAKHPKPGSHFATAILKKKSK